MKYLKKEEYIYMVGNFRMSKERMADVLYAGIVTNAKFTTLYSLSDNKDRKADAYNEANAMIYIHQQNIEKFEEIAKIKLEKPQVITGS